MKPHRVHTIRGPIIRTKAPVQVASPVVRRHPRPFTEVDDRRYRQAPWEPHGFVSAIEAGERMGGLLARIRRGSRSDPDEIVGRAHSGIDLKSATGCR
jgi:hypothetical protein